MAPKCRNGMVCAHVVVLQVLFRETKASLHIDRRWPLHSSTCLVSPHLSRSFRTLISKQRLKDAFPHYPRQGCESMNYAMNYAFHVIYEGYLLPERQRAPAPRHMADQASRMGIHRYRIATRLALYPWSQNNRCSSPTHGFFEASRPNQTVNFCIQAAETWLKRSLLGALKRLIDSMHVHGCPPLGCRQDLLRDTGWTHHLNSAPGGTSAA